MLLLAACTRRRGAATATGASPVAPNPNQAHLQVVLVALMLLHPSLAASKPPMAGIAVSLSPLCQNRDQGPCATIETSSGAYLHNRRLI